MASKRDLSVAEMLAYCRNVDGEGGSASAASESETTAPEPEAAAPAVASEAPQAAATPAVRSKMSVADMLAAARAEKSGDGGASVAAPEAEAEVEQAEEPAAAPSAAEPAAPADRSKMSVADMLAAARAEKSAPAAAKAPAKKPVAKAAAAKPAAKKAPAKPARSGPMDTSSILAAARSGVAKPGPMSKSEAAAKAKSEGAAAKKQKPKAPPMPAKPVYAQPVAVKPKAETDRRSMMEVMFGSMLAIGWGAMTAAAGLSSLMLARFFFPNLLIEPPSQFKVGFPGDFAADTVATKFKAQFGIWVVNAEYEGQRQIFALKSVCTHLGCTPNWLEAEQKFKCPCHGSGFYKDGVNFEGPAPRPLERYAIAVADDGQIAVDKSKTFQEQLGQWGDSASFVSV